MHEDALNRLNAQAKTRHPAIRPKDAATLIILDRSGPQPKVLLGRRHEGHAFMPGRFVFPGGRVERSDANMASATELDPEVVAKLTLGASARRARALALAAVRETFEETGLMLGMKSEGLASTPGGLWSAFAEAGIYPDLSALHYVTRAITPPGFPRRFDTRFFAVDAQAIVRRMDGVVGPDAELVELVWTPIAESKSLGIHPITATVLQELEARTAAGMGHGLPVPFYRRKNGRFVRELL